MTSTPCRDRAELAIGFGQGAGIDALGDLAKGACSRGSHARGERAPRPPHGATEEPRSPARRSIAGLLWGAWAGIAFAVLLVALWPAIVLAPSRAWAWRIASTGARLLLRATGTRVSVRGLEHLRAARRPCVVVANHTSELDVFAIAAALPFPLAPVAKRELGRNPLLRWPLARLGILFVRRGAAPGAASQIGLVAERLRAGQDVLIFPEGTFRRTPGLLPFRRGAFLAAALAGAPVVPVAVRGARAMTPGERAMPLRGAIELEIGAALEPGPQAPETAALALLAASRGFLLERTGEPDAASLRG
jgi:1-acyl-sn-glycerol-3-phosphate acyltransferase